MNIDKQDELLKELKELLTRISNVASIMANVTEDLRQREAALAERTSPPPIVDTVVAKQPAPREEAVVSAAAVSPAPVAEPPFDTMSAFFSPESNPLRERVEVPPGYVAPVSDPVAPPAVATSMDLVGAPDDGRHASSEEAPPTLAPMATPELASEGSGPTKTPPAADPVTSEALPLGNPEQPAWRAPTARKPINPIVWIGGVGAAIFLLGIIYLLTLTVQYIPDPLRFALALLAGMAITGVSARLLPGKAHALGIALLSAGLGTLTFTFRVGALDYHLFDPRLGVAASFVCTLLGGGLAVRARSEKALIVAILLNLAAPFIFIDSGHHEVSLTMYLAASTAALLAVPYLGRTGGGWRWARALTVVGTWSVLSGAIDVAPADSARELLGLLLLHVVLSELFIWLPRARAEKQELARTLHWVVSLAALGLLWVVWQRAEFKAEWFAIPVLGFGAINIGLVALLRRRDGKAEADVGLLVLGCAHLALAVPVALEWRFVGLIWALLALAVSAVANLGGRMGRFRPLELQALTGVAVALTIGASTRWVLHGLEAPSFLTEPVGTIPFLNTHFAEALFTSAAWGLLVRRFGKEAAVAVVAVELMAVLALSTELGCLVLTILGNDGQESAQRTARVVITLTWAMAGALQWLRSLLEKSVHLRRWLMAAGYAWLAASTVKLLRVDLEDSNSILKAFAFLGSGAIFLAAAVIGNMFSQARKGEP